MFFGAVLSLNVVQASYWTDPKVNGATGSQGKWPETEELTNLPRVESVAGSAPGSRESSFVKPSIDGSALTRRYGHITDQERQLLEKMAAEKKNNPENVK